jgi:hypothetical protein
MYKWWEFWISKLPIPVGTPLNHISFGYLGTISDCRSAITSPPCQWHYHTGTTDRGSRRICVLGPRYSFFYFLTVLTIFNRVRLQHAYHNTRHKKRPKRRTIADLRLLEKGDVLICTPSQVCLNICPRHWLLNVES